MIFFPSFKGDYPLRSTQFPLVAMIVGGRLNFFLVRESYERKNYANRYRECQPVWWNFQYSQLAERTLSEPKKDDIRIENKVFKKRSLSLTSRATSYTCTIWTGHDTTGLWEPSDDLTNMIPKISHQRSRCQRFQNS